MTAVLQKQTYTQLIPHLATISFTGCSGVHTKFLSCVYDPLLHQLSFVIKKLDLPHCRVSTKAKILVSAFSI